MEREIWEEKDFHTTNFLAVSYESVSQIREIEFKKGKG